MAATVDPKDAKSIYDFTVKDTYGNDVPLDKYKGKVCVIVNIASQCGLTSSNYSKLTDLKKKYENAGLSHILSNWFISISFTSCLHICHSSDSSSFADVEILSFPCNQFANEMPEKDGEEMVCHLKKANADLGVIFKKVDVNGDTADPLFKFLKEKQGGFLGDSIKWNFTKFLVDKNGQPVERFAPTTSPTSIEKKIDELLKQ